MNMVLKEFLAGCAVCPGVNRNASIDNIVMKLNSYSPGSVTRDSLLAEVRSIGAKHDETHVGLSDLSQGFAYVRKYARGSRVYQDQH